MSALVLYAVYNRDCGHVVAVHADRAAFEPFVTAMAALGRFSWRTRRGTEEDVAAIVQGDRCPKCEVTAEVVARAERDIREVPDARA